MLLNLFTISWSKKDHSHCQVIKQAQRGEMTCPKTSSYKVAPSTWGLSDFKSQILICTPIQDSWDLLAGLNSVSKLLVWRLLLASPYLKYLSQADSNFILITNLSELELTSLPLCGNLIVFVARKLTWVQLIFSSFFFFFGPPLNLPKRLSSLLEGNDHALSSDCIAFLLHSPKWNAILYHWLFQR